MVEVGVRVLHGDSASLFGVCVPFVCSLPQIKPSHQWKLAYLCQYCVFVMRSVRLS
jgi:hypothetical protein